jgi:hypothetical protein
MNKLKITKSEYLRLLTKISTDEKTGCWNWNAAKTFGYGTFNLRGKTVRVHRLIYEVFVEKLPKYDGVNVLDHVVCDNKSCCNPKHVKLVKQNHNVIRANSMSGINSRKTYCVHGHRLPKAREPLPSGNLGRRCIICRNINKRKRYHNRKLNHQLSN